MNTQTNFKDILAELNRHQMHLELSIKKFPWHDKMAYALWLANSYHYANHSTRILALAAGTMPSHLTSISNRFIQHAAEEKGHEKLLENDLSKLGFKLSDLAVSKTMQVYYRSLYYWTTPAGSPVGLLGWVLSLEALAANVGSWIYSEVEKAHGPKCVSFLKVHSDADPEHVEKALEVTKLLSDNEKQIVIEANSMYSGAYEQMLLEISSQYKSKSRAA